MRRTGGRTPLDAQWRLAGDLTVFLNKGLAWQPGQLPDEYYPGSERVSVRQSAAEAGWLDHVPVCAADLLFMPQPAAGAGGCCSRRPRRVRELASVVEPCCLHGWGEWLHVEPAPCDTWRGVGAG